MKRSLSGPFGLTHVKSLNSNRTRRSFLSLNNGAYGWLLNKKGRKQVLFGYLYKGGGDERVA
tara:strand:+ start:412 stop:597 length:186 start_codon:yes stop_codon:yes gene_type:complete